MEKVGVFLIMAVNASEVHRWDGVKGLYATQVLSQQQLSVTDLD